MRNVPDTIYKQKVFEVINAALIGKAKTKGDFMLADTNKIISFHMIFQDEWKNALNKIVN